MRYASNSTHCRHSAFLFKSAHFLSHQKNDNITVTYYHMTKHWVTRAIALLQPSRDPVPHEINELDWKLNLFGNKARLIEHLSSLANLNRPRDGGFSKNIKLFIFSLKIISFKLSKSSHNFSLNFPFS
jgi:hypothetical protein